jgi:hypothetical protein
MAPGKWLLQRYWVISLKSTTERTEYTEPERLFFSVISHQPFTELAS